MQTKKDLCESQKNIILAHKDGVYRLGSRPKNQIIDIALYWYERSCIVMEDNAKMREALGQISRMKTLPDHASNTFTLVTAHALAEQILTETSPDREIEL